MITAGAGTSRMGSDVLNVTMRDCHDQGALGDDALSAAGEFSLSAALYLTILPRTPPFLHSSFSFVLVDLAQVALVL